MLNAEFGMLNVEFRMLNVEFGMLNAECGTEFHPVSGLRYPVSAL